MAKLSSKTISTKVVNSFYLSSAVTIIVGFLSNSPLSANPWLAFLRDSTVCMAVLTILSGIAGYVTEEKSFDNDLTR